MSTALELADYRRSFSASCPRVGTIFLFVCTSDMRGCLVTDNDSGNEFIPVKHDMPVSLGHPRLSGGLYNSFLPFLLQFCRS